MKIGDFGKNSDKIKGMRLKKCRVMRGLTQEKLAEILDLTVEYISKLERGKRRIGEKIAEELADALQVSVEYLLCRTDLVGGSENYKPIDFDEYGNTDYFFLLYLLSRGIDISFIVVRLHEGKLPYMDYKGKQIINWSEVGEEVSPLMLQDMCFSDFECKLKDGDSISEVVIYKVKVNGVKMSYGQFVYYINRLYDYTDYICNSLEEFKNDYEILTQGRDSLIEHTITSNKKFTSLASRRFEEILEDDKYKITLEDGTKATMLTDELIEEIEKLNK